MSKSKFMCSSDELEKAHAIILGLPYDENASGRKGASLGPDRIRDVSYELEEFSWETERDLCNIEFYDMGNVEKENINSIIKNHPDKFIISLGGDHSVSYYPIKAMTEIYKDLVVIHFDAHMDMRGEYESNRMSHACIMRRVGEIIGNERIFHFGIRSGTEEEKRMPNIYSSVSSVDGVLDRIRGKPAYISLDIDVLDPAYAPGTGTPEPGGATFTELIEAIKGLSNLNIVGMDVVEVSPPLDCNDITSIAAAKIIRESLLLFTKSKHVED